MNIWFDSLVLLVLGYLAAWFCPLFGGTCGMCSVCGAGDCEECGATMCQECGMCSLCGSENEESEDEE